jgi:hypothetical protein
MDCPSAGIDWGWATADTQVAFNFMAPAAGLVEVVIEAESGLAVHELDTVDEWGWSQSTTTQQNFLMMHVLHPNVTGPSFAEMSSFVWDTDKTHHEKQEKLARGQTFFASLFSDGPVARGDVVEVRAGTRNDDSCVTDDVEIHSKSQFHWALRSVRVRIAP